MTKNKGSLNSIVLNRLLLPFIMLACNQPSNLMEDSFNMTSSTSRALSSYYVDATNGNDSNDGRSPSQAWQTLEKVNGMTFGPKDEILFKRGEIFLGSSEKTLYPKGSGAPGNPIKMGAYDSGNLPVSLMNNANVAVLSYDGKGKPAHTYGEKGNGLYLYNQEHWEIRDLEITCNDTEKQYRRGVLIHSGVETLEHIYLDGLYVHNIRGQINDPEMIAVGKDRKVSKSNGGIFFWVEGMLEVPDPANEPRFNDVIIENCIVDSVYRTAIHVYEVLDLWMYYANSAGDYDQIIEVENKAVMATESFESIAVCWTWQCEDAVFQYNEAYDTIRLLGNNDGMAWDADFGRGTIYQYNYSHDNQGGVYMICSWGYL